MLIDKSTTDSLKEYETGYLRLRIGAFQTRMIPDQWKQPNNPAQVSRILLVVNLFSARNLPSGDEDGFSDPRALIDHFGSIRSTEVIHNTLDPVWSRRIPMMTLQIDGYVYPMIVFVYDQDEKLLKNEHEYLGRAVVDINKMIGDDKNPNVIPTPIWYELINTGTICMGRISLSAQIFPPKMDIKLLRPINSKKERFRLKLYILGLRNLKSTGLHSIKQPFIKINMGSLKEQYSSSFGDILTSKCKVGGPDANFNNLITLDVVLPANMNIMPVLTVDLLLN